MKNIMSVLCAIVMPVNQLKVIHYRYKTHKLAYMLTILIANPINYHQSVITKVINMIINIIKSTSCPHIIIYTRSISPQSLISKICLLPFIQYHHNNIWLTFLISRYHYHVVHVIDIINLLNIISISITLLSKY